MCQFISTFDSSKHSSRQGAKIANSLLRQNFINPKFHVFLIYGRFFAFVKAANAHIKGVRKVLIRDGESWNCNPLPLVN
jgi:hypothetical protein